MPFAYPVPVDDTYDYVPITDTTQIEVGTRLFSILEVTGTVTDIIPGDSDTLWTYSIDIPNWDGGVVGDSAFLPDDPGGQSEWWWLRMRIVRQVSKPDYGGYVEGPDGSPWIYPATDGRITCYRTPDGDPVFHQGDNRFRGELTLDPHDIYTSQDADWDWLPVNSPSDVNVGDVIMFSKTYSVDVDEVAVTDEPTFSRREFRNASIPIGWVDTPTMDATGDSGYRWTFMDRIPNPDDASRFQSTDGAQWIYVGGSKYYCWVAGTSYQQGAAFHRGEISGGLTPTT